MVGVKHITGWISGALLAGLLLLSPHGAGAAGIPGLPEATDGGISSEVCTDFAKLAKDADTASAPGILTNITDFIKPIISTASQKLFTSFTGNASYRAAVNATITLMIVIYGVGFTIGVVQPSFGQLFVRLIKVGIIYAVISPGGWEFFSQYAVRFFNDATDELIGGVMRIGTGIPFAAGDSPFKALDGIANMILSPDMVIAIITSIFGSGPYGLAMGSLLGFAVLGFLKLMLDGLKTYAVSFIVRALLLGVAPIFIVFLLFDKTKQMFTGWLNSLINLSLKPILYFTFLSFFIVMLRVSSQDMLGGAEMCWTDASSIQGTENKMSGWRFKLAGKNAPEVAQMTWGGSVECLANGGKHADGTSCPEFPINILDILSFLILVYVAQKFSTVIDRLANDIASVSINLSTDTKHLLNTPETSGMKINYNAAGARKGV